MVAFKAGDEEHAGKMRGRTSLEPNGLPDPAGECLPAGHLLFPCRHVAIGGVKRSNDDRRGFARRHLVTDIELEFRVAAFMGSNFDSVHPNLCLSVDGPETQPDPRAVPISRDDNIACLPADLLAAEVLDARKLALPTEGYGNLSIEVVAVRPSVFQPFVAWIEAELPLAVEIHPGAALEVRTRVFGFGNVADWSI